MSSPVSGAGPTAAGAAAAATATAAARASASATTTIERSDQMGSDTFLQLLVAQMRYQDPSNPASSTDFIAQTATFTQVEKLEQLVTQNASMLVMQESATAGALVGRTATYTDDNGESVTGLVTSVQLATTGTEAAATIGGKRVAVGRLTEISGTTPAT
ncbi:MAG: flgD [Blastococcus sp.]|jgi:flagellar basal-body rod modification protein FlgD|nr:flgD [Blastococcus sp.]